MLKERILAKRTRHVFSTLRKTEKIAFDGFPGDFDYIECIYRIRGALRIHCVGQQFLLRWRGSPTRVLFLLKNEKPTNIY